MTNPLPLTSPRRQTGAWIRSVAWTLGIATLFVLLGVSQGYTSRVVEGLPANWRSLLRQESIRWYLWALLAPLIYAVNRRLEQHRRTPSRIILTYVVFGALLVPLYSAMEVIVASALGIIPSKLPIGTLLLARFSGTIVGNLVVFGLIALVFSTLEHYRDSRERQLRELALRAQLADAQLRALRVQLQPHFLFNTLHTASALMNRDVELARRVLTRLGDLLRAALARGDIEEVPLQDELEFLETYLEIQRIRFDGRLTVRFDVDPAVTGAPVPSMILQPLVENALQHAIEPRTTQGLVRIAARRSGNELVLEVADDGSGVAETLSALEHGIGLSNTARRLETLYQKRQRMEFARAPEGGLQVRVTLPFQSKRDI